jgi:hypothetical protein
MNIDKALSHFQWKLKNKWKPTELDVEAYNSILKFKRYHEQQTLQNNTLLAKLWIEKLILLNETKMYSAERSIQVIDEILQESVYSWCVKLHSKLSQMRLNTFLRDKYNDDDLSSLNTTKMAKTNIEIVDKYEKEIMDLLKDNIKEEDIIRFVEKHITRIEKTFSDL